MHRHLEDQLHFLRNRDAELHADVLAIQDEELSHLRHAEERAENQLSNIARAGATRLSRAPNSCSEGRWFGIISLTLKLNPAHRVRRRS